MKQGSMAVALAILVARPGIAQQPAPERVVTVSGPVQAAIDEQVSAFREHGRAEVLQLSDVLIYPFGLYQPVLTCTVLRACIVELEAGETLISIIVGDDQRWLIDHTATGSGAQTPIVSVKPIDHNLTTNLILSTDRRIYHITLDSPPRHASRDALNPLDQYNRHVRFYYPRSVRKLRAGAAADPAPEAGGLALNTMNYRYTWSLDDGFPWAPLAVFDDGERVYIRIPETAQESELPILSLGTRGQSIIVDFTVRNGYYIIDGLFERARLLIGGPKKRRWVLGRRRQTQHVLRIRAQVP